MSLNRPENYERIKTMISLFKKVQDREPTYEEKVTTAYYDLKNSLGQWVDEYHEALMFLHRQSIENGDNEEDLMTTTYLRCIGTCDLITADKIEATYSEVAELCNVMHNMMNHFEEHETSLKEINEAIEAFKADKIADQASKVTSMEVEKKSSFGFDLTARAS